MDAGGNIYPEVYELCCPLSSQPCENPVKFFTFYVREADLCYNKR